MLGSLELDFVVGSGSIIIMVAGNDQPVLFVVAVCIILDFARVPAA